jgi:carbamoyl-phosphate synthase large subunit
VASVPNRSDLIAQERLMGEEHTVNMFFDMRGQLRAVVPHLRIETRAGEVSKAETVRDPELMDIGWRLAPILEGARGVLCFQTMQRTTGERVVFEINARFGGGYPIAHRAGACFSKWLLEEATGLPPSANNEWRSGVRMFRYDAAVFK